MAGFPTIKPAFTVQVQIEPAQAVGSSHRKTTLLVVPMIGGTLKAEPNFHGGFEAESVGTGHDYIHQDPDGGRLRLDAHAVFKTKDDELLYFNYKGTVTVTPDLGALLAGKADELTTPYGDSFIELKFETGSEKYKDLENGIFVGQGHFVKEKGKLIVVEYKVGQVQVG